MKKKLKISKAKRPAIVVHRRAVRSKKLVYIAVANKTLKYRSGEKSKIVYIGMTRKGVDRISQSAASKAKDVLQDHGIQELKFYVVTCKGKKAVKTWEKLEEGLIAAFVRRHWERPICNNKGNKNWNEALKHFTKNALEKVIEVYSRGGTA